MMGSITHTFQSAIADDPAAEAAGEVTPSRWNEGHTFNLDKSDVGLSNVDNTSDANKPISTATQTALDAKVDEGAVTTSGLTMATSRLLGRTTASTGAIEEISIGSGLSLSSGTLSATGGGGGGTAVWPVFCHNVTYAAKRGIALSIGNNDIYTVPAGKRAYVNSLAVYNGSAGTISYYPTVKTSGGTYLRLLAAANINAGNGTNTAALPFVFSAGETIAVNTATTAGLDAFFGIIEFDDTSPLRSVYVESLSNGDNTIFTATAQAMVSGVSITTTGQAVGVINYANDSGGARTIQAKYTPSGGSTYATGTAFSLNSGQKTTGTATISCVDTGDAIVLNTDAGTATQWAWVTVVDL